MVPSQSTLHDLGNDKKSPAETAPLPLIPLIVRLLIAMNALSLLSSQILPMPTHLSTSSRCATSRELRMHALSLLGKMTSIMSLLEWALSTPLQCMSSTLSACMEVAKSTFESGSLHVDQHCLQTTYDAAADDAHASRSMPMWIPTTTPLP
jgi:hypothetical protein